MRPEAWGVLALIAALFTAGMALAARERRWPLLLLYLAGSFGGAWLGHAVANLRWADVLIVPSVLGGLVAALGVNGLVARFTRRRGPATRV